MKQNIQCESGVVDNNGDDNMDCQATNPITDKDFETLIECHAPNKSINTVNVDSDNETDHLPNWLETWTIKQLSEMQENDPDIAFNLNSKLDSEDKPPKSKVGEQSHETKILWGLWEFLEVKDRVLYKIFEKEPHRLLYQYVAPKEIRDYIFKQLHCKDVSGHFGRDRTLEMIKRRFYWPNMSDSVKRWCERCDLCARGKPGP